MSLRWRLLLAMSGIVVLALLLIGTQILTSLEAYYLGERQVAYLTQASVVAGQALDTLREAPLDEAGLVRLGQLAGDWGRQLGHRVLILDAAAQVLADTFADPKLLGTTLRHTEVQRAAAGQATAGPHRYLETGWVMYAASPVFSAKQVVGVVLVSASIGDVYRALDAIAERLAYLAGAVLAVAVVLGFFLSAGLTRPLARLGHAARRMAQGDFGVRVPARGASELAQVGRDFNIMASRLDQLEEARRAFVADASHELRTPLSSILALLAPLAGEHAGRVTASQRDELMGDLVAEVDRLDRLAGDLLDLARLDEAGTLRLARVALFELAQEVARRLGPVANAAGVTVEVEDRGGPVVHADELRLGQALHNLVDNAVKFAPAGGKVTITVARGPRGSALLEVSDTGPGIAPEHLPHLFDRFYRVDRARARGGGDGGGTGLGLAIVKRIARLHGGTVEVESEVGRGSKFRLVLPEGRR
jgi:signal transduction histidine kinase